jgi:hypothetical protein
MKIPAKGIFITLESFVPFLLSQVSIGGLLTAQLEPCLSRTEHGTSFDWLWRRLRLRRPLIFLTVYKLS